MAGHLMSAVSDKFSDSEMSAIIGGVSSFQMRAPFAVFRVVPEHGGAGGLHIASVLHLCLL